MNNVSNDTIFEALMDLKGDIGGLKSSNELFLNELQNHTGRISVLEGNVERQRGAVRVWGLIATGLATTVGAAIQLFRHP